MWKRYCFCEPLNAPRSYRISRSSWGTLGQLVQEPLSHTGVSTGARGGKHNLSGWPIKCSDLCRCLFCYFTLGPSTSELVMPRSISTRGECDPARRSPTSEQVCNLSVHKNRDPRAELDAWALWALWSYSQDWWTLWRVRSKDPLRRGARSGSDRSQRPLNPGEGLPDLNAARKRRGDL